MSQSLTEKLKSGFTWKRTAIGAVVLVILYVFIQALLPDPVPADVAEIARGPIEVVVHGEGKTRVKEAYVVSTPVTGRLQRVEPEPGDVVVGNETIIASIEPADPNFLDARTGVQAQARIRAAEAGLELAYSQMESKLAELDFANKEMLRVEELYGEGYSTRQALEQNQRNVRIYTADVETARANVQVAEFELEAAQAALDPPSGVEVQESDGNFILKSPVNGQILRLLHESEQVIQAGTPLVEIGDLRDMEIVADLLSTDAVKVRPGDLVHIDHWGGPHDLDGQVRLVEPSGFTKVSALGVEEQRVNVIVNFTGDRNELAALGDGFRVEVYVVVDEKEDALLVPISALFRYLNQWSVFVLDGSRARRTPVEIGLRNDRVVEILSGLEEGQTVIIHPSNEVDDNVKIRIR